MIKINLASKKKSGASTGTQGGGGGGFNLSLDKLKMDGALGDLKKLPFKKYVVYVAFAILATFISNDFKDGQIKALDVQVEKLNAEKPKLTAEANKMKGLEDLQKSMDSDEKVIRTKLDTIQTLISDRAVTSQILQEMIRITPSEVWLNSISLKGTEIVLEGYSSDFSYVSEFMKVLSESSILKDLNLKDTQTEKSDGVDVASFRIDAKKR